MADYADNFTSRYKITYQAHGVEHDMLWRYASKSAPPPEAFKLYVGTFLDELAPQLVSDWAVTSEAYSLAGTNFFLPLPGYIGTEGANGQGPNAGLAPNNANFQGLTTAGGRVSVYVYGFVFETLDNLPVGSTNFRLTAAESAVISSALLILNGNAGNQVGSDGETVAAWQQYANLNVNSYYQRKARS